MAEENRVKCWICKQFQSEKYTKQVPFLGNEETVCIVCFRDLKEREDQLDMEMIRDEEGTPTSKADYDQSRARELGESSGHPTEDD